MIRRLKTFSTANLVLAIGIVAVYLLYGLFSGLDMDDYFLAWRKWDLGRTHAYPLPAWSFAAVFHSAILITFIAVRKAEADLNILRFPCGVFGLLCVLGLWAVHWPSRYSFGAADTLPLVASHPVDYVLSWYVWSSHLLFALIGANDD